ncbi:flagellar hook protein FlgE [Rhodoplanes sp. TEM]|uniref:Flagellar hook protein FlgE n=1 Tax=Rhodoplanes tepidamans TaxID=200616 RepID=A0ABT5JAS5_RHOTP|nr:MULTISPECIES: flagellar hook protein FlgE [Rhodoplanes]MDC7786781.1 flagellar hook protein FlgE [Rhodoplanes tepidamans]MDC7987453.1 flagellar hook protein FlgE [Rhodoplanes sp. TEM]MDQ0356336.1 flagellar hook protein FlgE [Rhodoplanes tepidamans]
MSLSGALNSAVSALNSQSQAISMVSDNIANASTTGYKTVTASFESLLSSSSSSAGYSSGGVAVSARYNITEQGLLTSSSSDTAMAIDGNGFFVVQDESGTTYYTRNGDAVIDDADGYLTINGYYLMGWATDQDGNVTGGETAATLSKIDTASLQSVAAATTIESIDANLPADAAVGDEFTTTMDVYDSLGTASSVTVTWTKTGENTWTAGFSDATLATDSTVTTGTVTGSIDITFNADGTLASTSPDPATISITGWTTGAEDSTITLDLGTAGNADGLTQYSSDSDTPSVDLKKIDQDGLAYGSLTGITIEDGGNVTAAYSNGETYVIYKVAVATFANADGLTTESGGVYSASTSSGTATLHESGLGGAGSIYGGKLESSTADTTQEFSTMITAQQAYSAAAQVVSTVSDMYDTLMSAVR